VNVLVLDTEVYSNTGGQMSKATPRAAVSKFAAGGKQSPKKNLGLIAMSYQSVYVAEVAMGASDRQTVQAFVEAERYPGPALILAYSHCIAHGIPMAEGMDHQKTAVKTGHWFLYRYRPDAPAGQAPLHLDSPAPRVPYEEFLRQEARFQMLVRSDPDRARELGKLAKGDIERRWQLLNYLASYGDGGKEQS